MQNSTYANSLQILLNHITIFMRFDCYFDLIICLCIPGTSPLIIINPHNATDANMQEVSMLNDSYGTERVKQNTIVIAFHV